MAKKPALPTDSDGHLVLQGELFWKWKAVHEQMARCEAEIKLRNPMIDNLLDKHPELKQLIGERTSFIMQQGTLRGEYKGVLADLEKHFGFPMTNVSIDDITGRVHRLDPPTPEPSESAPRAAKTKGKKRK